MRFALNKILGDGMVAAFRLCISALGICAGLWPTFLMAQGLTDIDVFGGVTFRNTEFQFRFVYPAYWVQKTPRGPNVRALVSEDTKGPSNCNIVVRRGPYLGEGH